MIERAAELTRARAIYQRTLSFFDPHPPAFVAYERRFARWLAKASPAQSNHSALAAAIAQSSACIVGDFHTCPGALGTTRLAIKLARQSGFRVGLALEAFLAKPGRLRPSSDVLGEHCAPLVDLAQSQGLPLIGIDSATAQPGMLAERDGAAALRLAKAKTQFPDMYWIILVGQYHTAPSHLPRSLGASAAKPLTTLLHAPLELYEPLQDLKAPRGLFRFGPYAFAHYPHGTNTCLQSFARYVARASDGEFC